jgi:ABC-2 type transport system permease protein/sodium transport system permease protein
VDPIQPPVSAFAVGRLFRLARKELTEILRDRRTILTLLLMPLLLYPLLTIGFGQFATGKALEQAPVYRLGFRSAEEHQALERTLLRGVEQGPGQPVLRGGPFEDLDGAVRERVIDVGFRPSGHPGEWELVYREDSAYALDAVRYLEEIMARADATLLREGLKAGGIRPPPALRVRPAPLAVEGRAGLSLAVFVPLVLILMTITGAVYPAIDLTAGERERGTLEVLIAAPVPRVSLLFGKYVAVVTVAVLTALVNLGSMTVSLLLSGFSERLFPAGLRVVTLLEIFGLVLLFAAFFSAVLLVLTSFARSFKEAQAYLIPLMVVALLPGVLGLLPEVRLSGVLAVVPLLNIVLLARDLLEGRADPVNAAVVVIATVTYAVLAVALAAQVFGAEGVLYGESGGWRTLLRRGR